MDVAALVVAIAGVLIAIISAVFAGLSWREAKKSRTAAEEAVGLEGKHQERSKALDALQNTESSFHECYQTCAERFNLRRDYSRNEGWTANETNRARLGKDLDAFSRRLSEIRTKLHSEEATPAEVVASVQTLVAEFRTWRDREIG